MQTLPPPPPEPPKRKSRPVLVVGLIVAILLVLGVAAVSTRARSDPSLDIASLSGQILFSTARNETHLVTCQYPNCNYDVYLMDADGSRVRALADGPEADFVGSLSTDGSHAVFVSVRNDIWRFVEADVGSGHQRVLLSRDRKIVSPVWSPDGRSVVFSENLPQHGVALYRLDPQSLRVRRLTQIDASAGVSVDTYATWSPDGMSIAFARTTDATPGQTQIDVLDLTTGEIRTVTTVQQVVGIDWSPDGSLLAFGGQIGHDYEIFVVPASGGTPKGLTPGQSYNSLPAWSPDGAYLVFTSNRSGTNDLYVMRSDGSGVAELPTGGLPNGASSWSQSP